MQSITIHDFDEVTATWIRQEAERRNISEQALMLELIRQGIERERYKTSITQYHDLDSLAGTWSDEEAIEFLNAVQAFDHVDEALWQ